MRSAVGNPSLRPRQPVAALNGGRGRRHGRDVGSSLGLRDGEGGDAPALADTGRPEPPLLGRAKQADRAGAEALHRKGEVGQPRMARQHLPGDADGSKVEPIARVDIRGGVAQPAGLAQRRDKTPAGAVDVGVVADQRFDVLARPDVEVPRQQAVPIFEERPAEVGRFAHAIPAPRAAK